jgi:hypothetical protein
MRKEMGFAPKSRTRRYSTDYAEQQSEFYTQQSINDIAGDIIDVGLMSSRSTTLTLNHLFSHDLLASMFANITQTEMLENIATDVSTQGQDFLNWSTGVKFSYALTPLWPLSATYRYQHNDSDVPNGNVNGNVNSTWLGGNYRENQVLFWLTEAFPDF